MTTPQFPEAPFYRDGAAVLGVDQWETCQGCGREFVAGHICQTHRLCGICHQGTPIDAPPAVAA